jgi:hypothetical protein
VKLLQGADGLWLVGPADATVPVRALRGFSYLRELLRRPDQPVSALDLVTGGSGTAIQPGLGDVLDDRARDAYRRRLSDIERDLAEAEEWSDIGRLDALHAERDALVGELAAAAGLGGRPRVTGSSNERARVAATKGNYRRDRSHHHRRAARSKPTRHDPHRPAMQLPARPRRQTGLILDQRPQPPK